VIAYHLGATVVALRQLPSQDGTPTGDDVLHHAALAAREAMRVLVGGAMRTQDVGDLHLLPCPVSRIRPGTHGLLRLKAGIIEQFQGRRGLEEMAPCHV
jgi:hypothetical protein